MSSGVGRVNIDKAGGIIATGANTVFTNEYKTAVENKSVIGGPPNIGDVIVNAGTSVYAENNRVAPVGAITAKGYSISKASTNVFAGNGS